MIRFRIIVLICALVLHIIPLSASHNVNSSNVMKIRPNSGYGSSQRARALLRYNTQKANESDADDSYIPYDLQIVADAVAKLESSQCRHDAAVIMGAMKRRERWALNMFDSSSKFPVGILTGNYYQFGNFDECLRVLQPTTSEDAPIRGQYCLADVELFAKNDGRVRVSENLKERPRNLFNSTIYWGICVPASCTVKEVEFVVREIFTLATNHEGISVRLDADKCHIDQKTPLTLLEIIYGCLTGLFLAFIVLATIFHYYTIQQKKKYVAYNVESVRESNRNSVKEGIICFSVIKTVGKFLQTKPSSSNLECICGIKFISMFFIIGGHSLIFMLGGPVLNTNFYDEESTNVINSVFINSPLMVDTFLMISGFLMCYLFIIELTRRKGSINFLILYIARYIRLTPAYLVVIGFYCSFLFRLGDGPLWDSRVKLERDRCLDSWWTNLLYINNYVNTDSLCMFQSWYLAVDYHLFIIAPFLIYPLWRWEKIGKYLLGLCTAITIITPFWVTLIQKLDPTFLVFAPEVYDITQNFYFKNVYNKTHMRANSYCLGLIFGFLVYKMQTQGRKIPSYILWFGWIFSTTCGVLSMFSITTFYSPAHVYDAFEAAVYAALHRVAWCIFLGWVLIVCITDHATVVNRFLSWKVFVPLSRLTYCTYLVNGLVEIYSAGTLREGIYMSKFELGTRAVAHGLLTLVMAFVLCILFESPIHGLEKILLKKVGVVKENAKTNRQIDENSL